MAQQQVEAEREDHPDHDLEREVGVEADPVHPERRAVPRSANATSWPASRGGARSRAADRRLTSIDNIRSSIAIGKNICSNSRPWKRAAGNYDELQAEIGRRFPALSRQLQRIARFALERPQDVALDTVAAAAAKVEVQPSAMVRFAQALGYGGYSRHAAHLPRPAGGAQRPATASASRACAAASAAGERPAQGGAARLRRRLDRQPLAPRGARRAERCSTGPSGCWPSAERIHVLAQRRAFPVACYLSYALSQLELPVTLLDGVGGMVREQARGIGPRDVLVAVSFRNYSPDVIELAADCHRRGVPVVVITDSPMSPLARRGEPSPSTSATTATGRSARWWSRCASRRRSS